MLIIDRIKKIIEYKGVSTRRFCIDVGIANGFFDKVKDVGSEKLLKILNTYSDISAEWLLTGNGEMIKDAQQANINQEKPHINEFLRIEKDFVTIPIVDVSAAAGIGGAINDDHPEILDELKLPPFMLTKKSGRYYCARVRGDSMFPTLVDRDYIIVRFLQPDEWADMRDREVYFIVACDGSTYIKRIENRLRIENRIICQSDNTDDPHFCDFNIMGEEIANIYHVEWRFSNNISNLKESMTESIYMKIVALEERMNKLTEKTE
jgi:phage repressor protein C with HTH and peptisase S24 domain